MCSKVAGRSGGNVQLELRPETGTKTIEATDILAATGRTPNTRRLELDKAGVELDARGYIRVNEKLQTTAPEVWAMGECAGSPQFTHVAFDDFRVVRDNLLGGTRSTTGRIIPFCLFTDPELARVGMNESEAKAKNVPYRLARMPVAGVLRTYTVLRAAWIHEGVDCRQRSDSGFYCVRRGSERIDGSGPDGDAGSDALHRIARCHFYAPDHVGRPRRAFYKCCATGKSGKKS